MCQSSSATEISMFKQEIRCLFQTLKNTQFFYLIFNLHAVKSLIENVSKHGYLFHKISCSRFLQETVYGADILKLTI